MVIARIQIFVVVMYSQYFVSLLKYTTKYVFSAATFDIVYTGAHICFGCAAVRRANVEECATASSKLYGTRWRKVKHIKLTTGARARAKR